jgi:pimeloyl-ACP methyl ester carboxylesterase
MKTLIVAVLILLNSAAFAQVIPDAFAKEKKSVVLSTGITLKYIEAGDPSGIPILLLHGFTDTSRSFQLMIEQLRKINKSFHVIAPDLRGHGQSSLPDAARCSADPEQCFTQDLFIADLIALLDHLKIQKVNVVGHSMGSWIAQGLATNHPERLSHLVLIGTFVNGKENAAINGFLKNDLLEKTWRPMLEDKPDFNWPVDAYGMAPESLGVDVKKFMRDNWVAEVCADPNLLDAVLPETLATPFGTWIGAVHAMSKADTRAEIKKVKTPTLILWASQDVFMVASDQEQVKTAFRAAAKNGTKVVYKVYGKRSLPQSNNPFNEVGHNLHWAAPEEVAGDINAFVTKEHPVDNFPYASDKDVRIIISEKSHGNIEVFK